MLLQYFQFQLHMSSINIEYVVENVGGNPTKISGIAFFEYNLESKLIACSKSNCHLTLFE